MRWVSEAATLRPPDAAWQRAWGPALQPLLGTVVDASGLVRATDPEEPSLADVRLVAGSHLRPGAEYRLAEHVTTGVLRAWVGAERSAGAEWAPHDEPGRAHLEVQGLDRLSGLRGASTLHHLSGRLSFDLDAERLLDLEVEVPWLRVGFAATVTATRLVVELEVRGLGLWWPTLAPLFAAASSRVQRELDDTVRQLADGLTGLPTEDVSPGSWRTRELARAAERRAAATREIEAGMAEIARRQHAAGEAVRLEPWWRRTGARWQEALDALPAASWPTGDGLVGGDWPAVERGVTSAVLGHVRWRRGAAVDAEVERFRVAQLAVREEIDRVVEEAVGASRSDGGPWLTDADTDLSWLATPWSTVRHLTGAATDAEARALTEAAVAREVS